MADILSILGERWLRERHGARSTVVVDSVSINDDGAAIAWHENNVKLWGTRKRNHSGVASASLVDLLSLPEPAVDGPYRPELAEAFRQGARELQIDRLDVPPGATVEEGEGGVFVHCRVYVSDSERLPMPGEDDAYLANVMTPGCSVEGDEHQSGPGTFTVTGRPLFEIQCQAADEAEAAKRWHEALHVLAQPVQEPFDVVEGLEIAFFSDDKGGGEPVSDLYVDLVDDGQECSKCGCDLDAPSAAGAEDDICGPCIAGN